MDIKTTESPGFETSSSTFSHSCVLQTGVMSPGITALQLRGERNRKGCFASNAMPDSWPDRQRRCQASSEGQRRPPPRPHHQVSRRPPGWGSLSFYRMYGCKRKAGFTGLWFLRLPGRRLQPARWQLKSPGETTRSELISSCWSPSSANISTCLLINRHVDTVQTQGPQQQAIKMCLDPLK